MAYEPKTWECGEALTADALNHMEQGIAEASEGGGCDCGYECTETSVELFNGSLTTASMGNFSGVQFTPSQPIESDSIVVTLNGTNYTLPRQATSFGGMYGEIDSSDNPVFTNYPCAVSASDDYYIFVTPSSGTYQVVIKSVGANVSNISPCFAKAVGSVLPLIPEDKLFVVHFSKSGNDVTTTTKNSEVWQALYDGKYVVGVLSEYDYQTHGLLTGTEDEYGNKNYIFSFFVPRYSDKFDTSTLYVEYDNITLKYDDSVTAIIKTMAFAN